MVLQISDSSPLVRVVLAVGVGGLGVLTTAALHWFTKPYVHQLRYKTGTGMAEVTTMDVLGRERWVGWVGGRVDTRAGGRAGVAALAEDAWLASCPQA